MKIVKFRNGNYGIRKWTIFGYEYKDLTYHGRIDNNWWNCRKHFTDNCQDSLEIVKGIFRTLTDKGREVKFI